MDLDADRTGGRPRGPEIADEDAGRLLNAVLDGGINLIDTSPDYGRSEELIGRRRDEFPFASKCGCPIEFPADAPPYPHDYSPGNVRADVEQSLRRLRTNHLDLVQVHMSPSKATLEESHTVETLKDLQAEGKVRFIGMSGILPNLPDHVAMGVFDVFKIPYSAVQRDHEELITEAADGARARSSAAARRRGGGQELADRAAQREPRRRPAELGDLRHRGLLSEAGIRNMEFVLRFTLSHPACRPRSSACRNRSTWPQHRRRGEGAAPWRPLRRGQEAPPAPGSPLTRKRLSRGRRWPAGGLSAAMNGHGCIRWPLILPGSISTT